MLYYIIYTYVYLFVHFFALNFTVSSTKKKFNETRSSSGQRTKINMNNDRLSYVVRNDRKIHVFINRRRPE